MPDLNEIEASRAAQYDRAYAAVVRDPCNPRTGLRRVSRRGPGGIFCGLRHDGPQKIFPKPTDRPRITLFLLSGRGDRMNGYGCAAL